MLRELHIANLAVIEDATISLGPGLNVFTGQTGAGKSLVLGAFECLLGLRSGADLLRTGSDEGRVVGVFEITHDMMAKAVSQLCDQTVTQGDELLVTRKFFASGRTSCSINGQPTTTAIIRELGQRLVDIHGQHDHQYLLRPANQIEVLDELGQSHDLRQQFAATASKLADMQRQQAELSASAMLRKQQLDLYEFQAGEIDDADPQSGEFPELSARHKVLSNCQALMGKASQVHAALYEHDGSVVERLEVMTQIISEAADTDPGLDLISQQLRDATAAAREASFDLSRYIDRIEADPAELDEVESRINQLNRLIQKYADVPNHEDPAQAVIDYREQIQTEIDSLRNATQDLSELGSQIKQAQQTLIEIGGRLTRARKAAAARLIPAVIKQLPALGMKEAKLDIAFTDIEVEDSANSRSGLDRVEFLAQFNPGQEALPLRKIASGGELSRLMLAIKSVLSSTDRTSVLVFDEIDAKIGGRLGSAIGKKLMQLTMPSTTKGKRSRKQPDEPVHQVLCITHLPQIAAFGHRHFRVAKAIDKVNKRQVTRTTISLLKNQHRVDELAEMMAGQQVTETTRKQAEELIAAAA